jgi:hypothetical protein
MAYTLDIKQHEPIDTLEAVEAQARNHPDDVRILIQLGVRYREANRLEDATSAWTKAYEVMPESPEVRFFFLSGLWESGEKDSARVRELTASLKPDAKELTVRWPDDGPQRLLDCLNNHGLALVKGGISHKQVKEWDEHLKANLASVAGAKGYEEAADIESTKALTYVIPGYFIVRQDDPKAFAKRFKAGVDAGNPYLPLYWQPRIHVVALLFRLFFDRLRLWRTRERAPQRSVLSDQERLAGVLPELRQNGLLAVISRFLNRDVSLLTTHLGHSAARVISGGYDGQGGPHQDARIQFRTDLFSTLWIPFTPCGDGLAPALSTLPIRLHTYFPVDGGPEHNFRTEAFPEELYFEPAFEVGDILLHSAYTMHRTYVKKNMPQTRRSIDLRIF